MAKPNTGMLVGLGALALLLLSGKNKGVAPGPGDEQPAGGKDAKQSTPAVKKPAKAKKSSSEPSEAEKKAREAARNAETDRNQAAGNARIAREKETKAHETAKSPASLRTMSLEQLKLAEKGTRTEISNLNKSITLAQTNLEGDALDAALAGIDRRIAAENKLLKDITDQIKITLLDEKQGVSS